MGDYAYIELKSEEQLVALCEKLNLRLDIQGFKYPKRFLIWNFDDIVGNGNIEENGKVHFWLDKDYISKK